MASQLDVTELLCAWSDGDQAALDQLMPLVYRELHRMAQRHMRGQVQGHTLQTTALIHEAYLKLVNPPGKHWENRAHFFAVAAQAMRHILVNRAHARGAAKRGGGTVVVPLDEAVVATMNQAAEVAALDEALKSLEKIDARKSRIVELRYFGGLSVEETAKVLQVSQETVIRDWRLAKTWLLREMNGAGPAGNSTPR